jgi:hypothetical protein
MTGSVRTAGVNGKYGRPLCGVKGRRTQKDVKNSTTEARKLLKIKDRHLVRFAKRTHFGVEKVLILGGKRPFLTLNEAILSLPHTIPGG